MRSVTWTRSIEIAGFLGATSIVISRASPLDHTRLVSKTLTPPNGGSIEGMNTMANASNNVSATVIFDNGGGITVQLIDSGSGAVWAHYYNGEESVAAGDVRDALVGGDFSGYDGNEPEAHECNPTAEEIRNGGYRVERFDSLAELDAFEVPADCGWGNMSAFARYNAERLNEST